MSVRILSVGIVFILAAACEAPQDAGDEPASGITEAERIGTSPYTNCSFDSAPSGATYDLVILNGRVMDPECDFDGARNVGIKDGRIALITEGDISGKETVDASGHVVAPGFIDTHTHSAQKYVIKMAMMDGVTSAMDTELGVTNIAAWYDQEAGKWPINYGTCVAHEHARMIVMDKLEINDPIDASLGFAMRAKSVEDDGIPDWSVTVATREQINQITKILDKGLTEGALCIGTTPGYASKGVQSYELYEVQKVAARYGRPIGSHTRYHTQNATPAEATIGADEVIVNAMALNAPLIYSHNNDYGWWEIEEKLKLARAQGYNMWSEYYPYAGGSSNIGADAYKPEVWEDQLGFSYVDTIFDTTQGKFLTKEEVIEIAAKDPARIVVGYNNERFDWFDDWVKEEGMTVGSDGMWDMSEGKTWDSDPNEFNGHPRTSGTHSRVLKIARENNVPLMTSLKQLSYLSAYHLGKMGVKFFDERGRMQEGMAADIVIFNPKTVADLSDYAPGENGKPPKGMPHVIVGGKFVKQDGKAIDLFEGKPIRFEVTESKWKPLELEHIK